MADCRHDDAWWRNAIGYQVYIRSFADGDGDGTGDLAGLRSRLGYLADLGVDVVWITPCFPSPGLDHGYDVSDYRSIDPLFGDLAEMDGLLCDAHDLGLRVLLDIVPNHSSDRHPWFQRALADPTCPERDYYVWHLPAADGGPPNNWLSHFGGSAWTLDPDSGEYYLHLFLAEQPDLNWRNPALRAEFDAILRYWFERGVDGFRVDVAHSLIVDEEFRSNPEPEHPAEKTDPRAVFDSITHVHDLDQPATPELYRPLHAIADEHDAVLVGEVYLDSADKVGRYVEDGRLHIAFYFPSLHTGWNVDQIRSMLVEGVAIGRGRFAWPMSSHDDPRAAARFGGGALGRSRQQAYMTMLVCLPGMPFLYQGDELGLDNAAISRDDAHDPISVRNPGASGRDGSRSPIPWGTGPNLGFTSGTPWLPIGSNRTVEDTVEFQTTQPDSPLARTRHLLARRRTLTGMLATDEVIWLDVPDHVIAFQRGDVIVAMNVDADPVEVSLPWDAELAATSADGVRLLGRALQLPRDRTAVVVSRPQGSTA